MPDQANDIRPSNTCAYIYIHTYCVCREAQHSSFVRVCTTHTHICHLPVSLDMCMFERMIQGLQMPSHTYTYIHTVSHTYTHMFTSQCPLMCACSNE